MMPIVAEQYAFDALPVVQFQKQFFRTVIRLLMRGDLRGPNREILTQPCRAVPAADRSSPQNPAARLLNSHFRTCRAR